MTTYETILNKRYIDYLALISSEAVQLAAVKENGEAIRHISNPSEAVQLAAVKENGYIIQNISNPSEAVQLAAVTQNCFSISYIKHIYPSVIKHYEAQL